MSDLTMTRSERENLAQRRDEARKMVQDVWQPWHDRRYWQGVAEGLDLALLCLREGPYRHAQ